MTRLRLQYLGPVILVTLCLVTLCAITASSLYYQQATTTQVLRENVESRRAAAETRACLNLLVELEIRHVESVSDLHAKTLTAIEGVRRLADQPRERELVTRLAEAFDGYLLEWSRLPPVDDVDHATAVAAATETLQLTVLPPCREVEQYNDGRVDDSTATLERVLRQLTWGMAGVGGLGGVAGVVLGFGVARSVARSIRGLRVQIRDAAGKLGTELPEIVVTGEGDLHGLPAELDHLSERIGEVMGVLQQRNLEVLRAEQLAAVGQLAAGVGHEIRNPLTSIKMLVQAGLEDGGRLAAEDLAIIEAEVRRMEKSLRTFLDFARPPRAERQPIDLCPIVAGVAELIRGTAERQRVRVRLELPTGGATMIADGEQLRQVLVNLSLNAIEAMTGGGDLSIAVRTPAAGRVDVEVTDSGPGISPEMMPRLFEPFQSSKDTGLGLGLVISKRIVEDHGGTIAATTNPAGGATLLVALPTNPPPETAGSADADPSGRR